MQTHFLKYQYSNNSYRAARPCSTPQSVKSTGLISELVYSENELGIAQLLLVPLLQQLGTESRWQLWLTPGQKLSRSWLTQSGLPLNKVMQLPVTTVEAMIKALQTGNYSVVLGWLPEEITADEQARLQKAATCGQALGLIMRPDQGKIAHKGPLNGLKIQSGLYH